MSKLSALLISCIFATLSLTVNSNPVESELEASSSSVSGFDPKPSFISSSSTSTDDNNNNNNQTDTEIHSQTRQKRSSVRNGPSKARLYPLKDWKTGSLSRKTYDSQLDGRCMDLPADWVESVDTVDTTVCIYIDIRCSGNYAVLEPGTDFHGDVRHLFHVGSSPRSIGICR